MRRLLPILLLLCCALALPPAVAQAKRGACIVGVPGPGCEVWKGKVVDVGDGDTFDVDVANDGTTRSRRIRFAGVQAMEQSVYSARHRLGDCHAVQATERVERLVRRSKGRVRLAAEDPLSMSEHRFIRSVAVRSKGRWTDVGDAARPRGPGALVADLVGVGVERDGTACSRSRRARPASASTTRTPAASAPARPRR